MSKRKRRSHSNAVTTTAQSTQSGGITSATNQSLTAQSHRLTTSDPGAKWRWLLFLAVLVCLTVGTIGFTLFNGDSTARKKNDEKDSEKDLLALLKAKQGKDKQGFLPRWTPPAWKPVSEEDWLIDRFVQARKKDVNEAEKMLVVMPPLTGPVNETQFEARAAAAFLRDRNLTIVDVWKGEPDRDGRPRTAKGRYMLVTRGSVSMAHIPVRDEQGNVAPASLGMYNPVLVVEVLAGKDTGDTGRIQPLRTERNAQ